MSENFDPKELKILSDILALVLEDQPGQSQAALEAIRSRAKRNRTTGGALKNLFTSIAPNPPRGARAAGTTTRTRSARATSSASNADLLQARQQIRDLTNDMNRLDRELRETRSNNAALRAELFLTRQARAEIQAELMNSRAAGGLRVMLFTLSFIIGCMTGIASAELYHTLRPGKTVDKAIYLH